jgi:diphthine synthase
MLHLIGIGYKKENLSFEMLEIIKSADEVFLEYYTSFYQNSFEELEEFIGKKITVCDREVIETQIEDKILKPAKDKTIALLVIGDPLIATTHTDLVLRCHDLKVQTKIYNNVSIGNFITRTGLQFYKFGKITSIPFYNDSFMPRGPYLVHLDNHKMGAHSLFLLDLNPSDDVAYKGHSKYLKAHEAIEFMLRIPKYMVEQEELEEIDSKLIDGETPAVICSRLGFDDEEIVYDTMDGLAKIDKARNFKEPLCLIIPGDMHEMEERYLKTFHS